MIKLECFFDCSSPWTYLCFHNLPPIAEKFGVPIVWRPILVGGVFNAVNPSVYASRDNPVPAKAAYSLKIMQDWADVAGIKIKFPPGVFPVNSVKAMRACCWLDGNPAMPVFARAVFESYFSRDEDISRDDVLENLSKTAGIDPQQLLTAIAQQDVKDQLRRNTDELIERGGFGSPTLFIDDTDMYFGNDSLPLVRAALARKA